MEEEKKHILFVSSSLDGGGAERALSTLANDFSDMGYDVEFIALHSRIVKYKLRENIRLKFIDYKGSNRITSSLSKLTLLRHEIRKSKSHIIVTFMYETSMYVLVASLGLGKKVIISERNDPYQEPNSRFVRFLRNSCYQLTDWLVCQTNDAKDYFNKRLQMRSSVILNPVNISISPFTGERTKRVATWCRLSKQKNIPLLLDAFYEFQKKHSEYRLDIYGEGKLLDSLKAQSDTLGISNKVNFCGFSTNVHKEVYDATMFVLPSNYEGLSNSMLEAMMLGIPTICTDCPIGGARMVIKNGENGILVPVNDKDALIKAMCKIAEDKSFATKLSRNSVKLKQQLDSKVIAKQWEHLIESVE